MGPSAPSGPAGPFSPAAPKTFSFSLLGLLNRSGIIFIAFMGGIPITKNVL